MLLQEKVQENYAKSTPNNKNISKNGFKWAGRSGKVDCL